VGTLVRLLWRAVAPGLKPIRLLRALTMPTDTLTMDTNTHNCIIFTTYTDIYPILVAGRVLTLTHLAAKDNFEDARLVVIIIVTLCVIIRANTGTCTTCGDNTTTKIGCKPFRGRDTASSV